MTTVNERAYAKINLYLDVTARRPDGFHELTSVMQTVSLYDEVEVRAALADQTRIILSLENAPTLGTDSDNLAYRAATAYLDAAHLSAAVHITLYKRIPIGAGLGGGSADAAAVLRAMQSIFGALENDVLYALAATLGSDVPFCLLGGTAVCHGRGERVNSVPARKNGHYVLAFGTESVSTPEAYRLLDAAFSDFDGSRASSPDGLADAWQIYLANSDTDMPSLYNIFESVILPHCPIAASVHEQIKTSGYPVLMSGSGPTVFAITPTADEARTLVAALKHEGIFAIAVTDAAL